MIHEKVKKKRRHRVLKTACAAVSIDTGAAGKARATSNGASRKRGKREGVYEGQLGPSLLRLMYPFQIRSFRHL